jgi:hypothetical protein
MNGNGGRESKNLANGINKTSIMVLTGSEKSLNLATMERFGLMKIKFT